MPDTPADRVAADASDNFVAWAQMLAAHCADGEAFDIDDMPVACIGIAGTTPNAAYVVRSLCDPARQLGQAIAYFDSRRLPGAVLVREGIDARAEAACDALGLVPVRTLPAMALALLPVSITRAPRWLEIRRDSDADAHALHVATDAAGFGAPLDMSRRVFPASLLDAPGYNGYTGYVDGVPVATSVLWQTNCVAGVFGVSVIEAQRRRGIGGAMTWHAVREGVTLWLHGREPPTVADGTVPVRVYGLSRRHGVSRLHARRLIDRAAGGSRRKLHGTRLSPESARVSWLGKLGPTAFTCYGG